MSRLLPIVAFFGTVIVLLGARELLHRREVLESAIYIEKATFMENDIEETQLKNVLLLGKFNLDIGELVLDWALLMRQIFDDVVVVGPFSESTCMSLESAEIPFYLCQNDKGVLSHYTDIGTVMTATTKEYKGFWIMHDDAVINVISMSRKFNTSLPWIANWQLEKFPPRSVPDIENSKWPWASRAVGVPAVIDAIAKSKGTKFEITEDSKVWVFEQADVYYIPWDQRSAFTEAARWLGRSNVFLEIAVPYIFLNLLSGTRSLSLCTAWNRNVRSNMKLLIDSCEDGWDVAHPVKIGADSAMFHELVKKYAASCASCDFHPADV
eukprot:Selendium_serpulae@DN6352_c0_g1_i2.p1